MFQLELNYLNPVETTNNAMGRTMQEIVQK